MLKVSIFNFKGGTGKSTTALNLGAAMASSERRVLLIDLDGQRTLSFGLGLDGESPNAVEWLTGNSFLTPLPTATENLSIIPGGIDMFHLRSMMICLHQHSNVLRASLILY